MKFNFKKVPMSPVWGQVAKRHSLRNMFTFFNKYMFRNWHDKICFKNFETYISYKFLFKDGKKGKNIFSFVIPYRKGRVDNDHGQGHFSVKKVLFPEKDLVLAGTEHYTSVLSRYSANHYTHRYL